MVHQRVNERETNPNPHINFITPLPADPDSQEYAKQLLRALAAQVRPIMKTHGFSVNSLEEYEYNAVFAGRNWNNGEVVELVLRKANGGVVPTPYLISTLCHELAHIKHMNHGPAFQALWAQLRKEVRELQNKGYYGDGYWSTGRRLTDSAEIGGMVSNAGDLPEYMCGGAQTRTRPSSFCPRRRTTRTNDGPSNHTGAQTTKKRKAGVRVKAANAFVGGGKVLSDDIQGSIGTGFRKQAASKRAREERALAAERRIRALQAQDTTKPSANEEDSENESEAGDEETGYKETDEDRRCGMDPDQLKTFWDCFADDFQIPTDVDASCNIPIASGSGTFVTGSTIADVHAANSKGRATDIDNIDGTRPKKRPKTSSFLASRPTPVAKPATLGLGSMVKTEVRLRKNESVGLSGRGRKLGEGSVVSRQVGQVGIEKKQTATVQWGCLVCTLHNKPNHLVCSACSTPRGELT